MSSVMIAVLTAQSRSLRRGGSPGAVRVAGPGKQAQARVTATTAEAIMATSSAVSPAEKLAASGTSGPYSTSSVMVMAATGVSLGWPCRR